MASLIMVASLRKGAALEFVKLRVNYFLGLGYRLAYMGEWVEIIVLDLG